MGKEWMTKGADESDMGDEKVIGRSYPKYVDGDEKAGSARSQELKDAKVMCMDR